MVRNQHRLEIDCDAMLQELDAMRLGTPSRDRLQEKRTFCGMDLFRRGPSGSSWDDLTGVVIVLLLICLLRLSSVDEISSTPRYADE